jgi:hypothetical protein
MKMQADFMLNYWLSVAESELLKMKINYMNWRYFRQLYRGTNQGKPLG